MISAYDRFHKVGIDFLLFLNHNEDKEQHKQQFSYLAKLLQNKRKKGVIL